MYLLYIYLYIFFLGYCTKIVQINPVLYARAQLHTFRSLLSRRYSLPRTGPWHSCPATWCLIAILPQLIRVITLEQSVPFYMFNIKKKNTHKNTFTAFFPFKFSSQQPISSFSSVNIFQQLATRIIIFGGKSDRE